MALRARLIRQTEDLERRGAERHPMRMQVLASARDETSNAMLHDLSRTGMRLETSVPLAPGDEFSVELTADQSVVARVVWREGNVSGCEFLQPLSETAVMETLLRSPFVEPSRPEPTGPSQVEEIPIGENVDLNHFAEWHAKFQEETGRKGSQLLGFRRAPDGTIIAIVTKHH